MEEEILIKFLLRETNTEEDILVSKWIAADPANKKQFSQIEQIWSSSKALAIKSTVNENEAWQKFKARIPNVPAPETKVRSLSKRYNWLKIAAVLFLVAGASLWYILNRAGITTLVADQQVLVKKLPDGSEITLNKNSSISYKGNLDGAQRNVSLQKGEVFFNVKPDKSKPFIIDADNVMIQVVGTSFNVKAINKQTEVIVETGIVRVSVGSQQVELQKGEKVMISKGNNKLIKQENTDQLYTYYRSKLFIADNTPLWRVIEVLSEAYEANISVEDATVGNLTLTTTFKEGTLNQTLNIISETLDLKVVRNGQNIVLKK